MLVIAIYIRIHKIPKLGMRGNIVMYNLLLDFNVFQTILESEWITKTVNMHMVLR